MFFYMSLKTYDGIDEVELTQPILYNKGLFNEIVLLFYNSAVDFSASHNLFIGCIHC